MQRTPTIPGRLRLLTGAAILTLCAQFAFAGAITDTTAEVPEDLFNVDLSQDLLDRIATALPEGSAIGQSFLDPRYSPNLLVSQDAQISVTAIDEGAGYRNAFGYFTYATRALDGLSKGDIDANADGNISLEELQGAAPVAADWVFPNFSMSGKGGQLDAGDSLWLGNGRIFEAGSTVGFFLVQDAWEGGSTDLGHQTFFSLDFLNPEAGADATIGSAAAASLARHTAALFADDTQSEIIFGFEDLNRADRFANINSLISDEDFNDAIFLVRSNPIEALRGTNIPTAVVYGPLGAPGVLSVAALVWLSRNRRFGRADRQREALAR